MTDVRVCHRLLLVLFATGCANGRAGEPCADPAGCPAAQDACAGHCLADDAAARDDGPIEAADAAASPAPADAGARLCGDQRCEGPGEDCRSCPADCAPLDGPPDLTPDNWEVLTGPTITFRWSPHCHATRYDIATYHWDGVAWQFYFSWSSGETWFTYWPQFLGSYAVAVSASNAAGTGPYSPYSYYVWNGE